MVKGSGFGARPSMVVRVALLAWRAGIRQELASSPLKRMAQAPHSPSPQPSFVPVRWRSSRRTSRRRFMGGTVRVVGVSLMMNLIWVIWHYL